MKRCPQCYASYEDQARFCENDGHDLLVDPASLAKPEVVVVAAASRSIWPAATLGVVAGVVIGAGVFAVAFLFSRPETHDQATVRAATEVHETALPRRAVTSDSVPTPEPEASPSPDEEQEAEAEAEPSPAPSAETQTTSVRLNQGPISTGEKPAAGDGDNAVQTVIEMKDGSTLDVEAAWEDKQGVWYRRSGLVSFVDSSRVKAITSRRDVKASEVPHH
jgi:hypothetical protein